MISLIPVELMVIFANNSKKYQINWFEITDILSFGNKLQILNSREMAPTGWVPCF